jgi:two-component system sensor histidine kinase/response regulator
MTANVLAEDRQRCEQAGMNDFMPKPIEPEVLCAILLRWIAPRQGTGVAQAAGEAIGAGGLAALIDHSAEAPHIAGLDTTAGLHRVLGKLASYHKLLRIFLRDQAAFPAQLAAAMAAGDQAGAAALLHTLRGVAGNIGAVTVQALAHQMERTLKQDGAHETMAELARLQTALVAELKAVMGAIEAALPEAEPAASAPARAAIDEAQLESVCQRLLALLADNDSRAERLLQEHSALLRAAFDTQFARIEMLLDQFDFELAHELLTTAWRARQAGNSGETA